MSGLPLFGSRRLKMSCFTYGLPSTNLIAPLLRSRKYRYPLRVKSTSPLIVLPLRVKSISSGGATSSKSQDSFGVYWK